MEEMKERSYSWLKLALIAYGVCILLSLVGVVLGATNYVAGPIHYSSVVLVLWLLLNLLLFGVIFLHLIYYPIKLWRYDADGGMIIMYLFIIIIPVIGGSVALLINKHFGWFSAGALVTLIICGVIDWLIVQR